MDFRHVACWIVDYAFVFAIFNFADHVYHGSAQATLFQHCLFFFTWIIGIQMLREFVFTNILPSTVIPKVKVNPFKVASLPSIIFEDVRATAALIGVSFCLTFAKIAYWQPIFVGSFSENFWRFETFLLEGYAIWILKDIFSMSIIHRLMHTPRFWWIHKHHHTYTKEMSYYLGATFDVADVLLENAAGLVVWIPMKYFLYGDYTLHLAPYFLVVWFDITCHSSNPFSANLLNPVLDWIFRANVNHNLHHAVINGHYTLFPAHHIVPSMRHADLAAFDKHFGTEISL